MTRARKPPAAKPATALQAEPAPEPPRTARASLRFDKAFCAAVVAYMGRGYSLTAFGGEIGVSRETLDAWRAKHPQFERATKVAEAARVRVLESKLLNANAGAQVSAHVFALKHAAPEEWRDKAASNAADGGGEPVKLELAIRFV